jgi:putative ABC transport system permease protein
MRVPLAWRNLTADRRRLATSTLGIAFAVLLMLMQLGFRNALVDSPVELLRWLNGDVVLISSAKYQLNGTEPFPRRRLFQAAAVEGVVSAIPVYLAFEEAFWKSPQDQSTHQIRVVGVHPDDQAFQIPEVSNQIPKLRRPDVALIDAKCRRHIGRASSGDATELTRRRIEIVGEFQLGTDFLIDGSAIVSDRTFLNLFPAYRSADPLLNRVEIGLLRVSPGTNISRLVTRLNDELPNDVTAMSLNDFIEKERLFWMNDSPVGLVFNLGTLVGFIVGTVICSQILFTDISERMPQYATLKAIGYTNGYLRGVVMSQAILLALVGFVPGVIISWGAYQLIASLTGLLMRLQTGIAVVVLLLTIGMCLVSGWFAVRTVLAADPADVF